MHIDITPKRKKIKRDELKTKANTLATIFIIALLLPIITYFVFHFIGPIKSIKGIYPESVALVNTGAGTGSAFLVGETRLLTARHVVEDVPEGEVVELTFTEANPPITTNARVIWIDQTPVGMEEASYFVNYFAVLELVSPGDIPEDHPRLTLGTSEDIIKLDEVIAVGYPAGDFHISTGTIGNEKFENVSLFKLDVNVDPGNSGGPLIYAETKEVIGIVVAGMQPPFDGITMSNKIDNIQKILQRDSIDILK